MGGCDLLLCACSGMWGKPQRLPQSSVDEGIKVASHTERSWTSVRRSHSQDLLYVALWLSCSPGLGMARKSVGRFPEKFLCGFSGCTYFLRPVRAQQPDFSLKQCVIFCTFFGACPCPTGSVLARVLMTQHSDVSVCVRSTNKTA